MRGRNRLRAAIVTSRGVNVGDALIEAGVRRILAPLSFEWRLTVDKHRPLCIFGEVGRRAEQLIFRLPRGRHLSRRVIRDILRSLRPSPFKETDVIVFAGTPWVWPGCARSEWGPLLQDVIDDSRESSPPLVLELGRGSAYPWVGYEDVELSTPDWRFASRSVSQSSLFVTRDSLAQSLAERAGGVAHLLPCPAFLWSDDPGSRSHVPGRVPRIAVNYMHGGGHFLWNQALSPHAWAQVVRDALSILVRQGWRADLVSHSKSEAAEALKLLGALVDQSYVIERPPDYEQLPRYSLGLANRMHVAIGLASLGTPSVAIGTDTRLLMPKAIGLPTCFVGAATVQGVITTVNELEAKAKDESARLRQLRHETLVAFRQLVGQVVNMR